MTLNKDQEALYKKAMEEAKAQLETIDDEMEEEIRKARERLAKLQESKKAFRQLYESAATLLGVEIEPEEEPELESKDAEEAETKEEQGKNK